MNGALDTVTSLKTKLGALVAISVVTAVLLSLLGTVSGVPVLLVLPVSVALALGVTQLLAAGMTSPLRQMTEVAQRMARGDYRGRVVTTSTDEVGQLAAAFNQMAADLAAVDAERKDLIATVSHELRTPLTAMTATLENLVDGVVAADAEHLAQALAQAERLRNLVGDLLDLSRLEAGVVPLHRERMPLRTLAEEAVRDVQAAGRTAAYDLQIPAELLVDVDRTRMGQLLRNVLDNAGRHAPADSAVKVLAGQGQQGWWMEVADRGPGVAPGERSRVFERFGTTEGGGTGVGLAISQWVARLHSGSLAFLDPQGGVGARLRLSVCSDPAALPSPAHPESPRSSVAPAPRPVSVSPAVTVPARPVLDVFFGDFWPDAPGSSAPMITAAAVAGVFGGVAMSFTDPGVSWTLLLLVSGGVAFVSSRRRGEWWTRLCTVLAVLLVLPFTFLAAGWIAMLCLLTAAAVFLCGLTGFRSPLGLVLSGVAWPLAALRGSPWFGRSLRLSGTSSRARALVRTAAWSGLALVVFGALFASADAVFASWVDVLVPTVSFNQVVGRVFVGLGIFALTLAAVFVATNPPDVEINAGVGPPALRNRFEWLVPVLAVDAVFVVFLVAQASAFFGGHDYIERTTGLTYADYVHQGFGQLTVATALTLLVVWVAARRAGATTADRWWLRGSLGVLCVLTLVVVASALHRMHLYQEAYGFTALRLTVDVFEGWLGFVVVAVMVLGAAGWGRWVPRVALVSGAVAVLGIAGINPDAWVAERNIERYEATGKLDLSYLQSLSPDAAPVIAERLPEPLAACVLRPQALNGLREDVLEDPRVWNLGRERARDAVRRLDVDSLDTDGLWTGECQAVWSELGE